MAAVAGVEEADAPLAATPSELCVDAAFDEDDGSGFSLSGPDGGAAGVPSPGRNSLSE